MLGPKKILLGGALSLNLAGALVLAVASQKLCRGGVFTILRPRAAKMFRGLELILYGVVK